MDQFADDREPFTREELDRAVPNNPVLLQASYYEAYLNSRALQALGASQTFPSGRVPEDDFRALAAKIPTPSSNEVEASTRSMIRDLNRMGLTAFGSAGCEQEVLGLYRTWADRGELNVRVFCNTRSRTCGGRWRTSIS
jgi:predicted amidohydrolase YtcJ